MTSDHDFGYSFPLFSSLLIKRGEKKRRIAKIVIKRHAFLLDLILTHIIYYEGVDGCARDELCTINKNNIGAPILQKSVVLSNVY